MYLYNFCQFNYELLFPYIHAVGYLYVKSRMMFSFPQTFLFLSSVTIAYSTSCHKPDQ